MAETEAAKVAQVARVSDSSQCKMDAESQVMKPFLFNRILGELMISKEIVVRVHVSSGYSPSLKWS